MLKIYIGKLLIMHGQYRSPDKLRDPRESQEQVAHKVAWAAVEKKYKKNSEGKWISI